MAILHSVSERQSKDRRQSISLFEKKSPKLIGCHSNVPWAISKRTSVEPHPHVYIKANSFIKFGQPDMPILAFFSQKYKNEQKFYWSYCTERNL